MLYRMNKPSANMLLNNSQIQQMNYEQRVKLYNEEQELISVREAAERREKQSYLEQQRFYINNLNNANAEKRTRLQKIKEAFISECIFSLYKESVVTPMTERDKVIARNLVNKFVIENGADTLISSFATKNLILSEFSRISKKYYNRVLNEGCKKEECQFTGQIANQIIDKNTVDDFYTDLQEVDIADASKAIKDRVSDAINEFIDTNAANKLEYEEIINSAKDKVAALNGSDEALAENYINMAKRKINDRKNFRELSVFGYMVESLTSSVFKDESLKARYIHEGTVDMEGIIDSTQLIYTMLEMANTTNMITVNEEFIDNYLKSL